MIDIGKDLWGIGMNGTDLKNLREKLGKTQAEFSTFIGTGLRQYQKWEADDAPIRPVMETAIRNAATLIGMQRTVAQAKNVQAKYDSLIQVVGNLVKGLEDMGASTDSCGRIKDLLAQNKVPTTEDVQRLLGSCQDPSALSAQMKGMVISSAQKFYQADGEDGFASFGDELKSSIPDDQWSAFLEWAESNFVMTSPDTLKSIFKAANK